MKTIKEELIDFLTQKAKTQDVKAGSSLNFMRIFQFELKPKFWQKWVKDPETGKIRIAKLNDFIIDNEYCTITWLGRNQYQIIVKRNAPIFITESEVEDNNLNISVTEVGDGKRK